jgi:hypothetical protein
VPRRARHLPAFALAFAGISAVAAITGIFALVTTFALPACNLAESDGGGCPSVVVNRGNGETTCGNSTCSAGMYCVSDAGVGCASGCTATAQCPYGNYCDMTNPVPDLEGNPVGSCQPPTMQQQNGPCPDDGGSEGGADASSTTKDAGR